MKTPAAWIAAVLVLLGAAAGAQPLFYVNETRLFATAARGVPDLVTCRLPDDAGAGAGAGALFPAQSAKSIWLWASLVAYPAYRPVTVQVVGLRSRRVVRAWDQHEFADGIGCVAGSFAIGALRDEFGAEQLLAQLIVDDYLIVSVPLALVSQPAAVGRSVVAVAPRAADVACDFGAAPAPASLNVTDDAVAYFCVDVDLIDRRRPASIQLEMRTGSAVVSAYRNDGADLSASTTLFIPVPIRQLIGGGADRRGATTFSAQFRYGGRLMATQNFTLAPGSDGGSVRFCPGTVGNCSSTANATA